MFVCDECGVTVHLKQDRMGEPSLTKCTLIPFGKEYKKCALLVVNDIAASEDILGEIILYKTLSRNIFVYYIMSALYFINIIF